VSEAHLMEHFEGGADVGTLVHRTAAAIENDVAIFGLTSDGLLKIGNSFRRGGGAGILRTGYMRRPIENIKADVNYEWRFEVFRQLLRLDDVAIGPGIGRKQDSSQEKSGT